MVRRHEDDMSLAIMERARNKESITLNLKDPRGAIFERLVSRPMPSWRTSALAPQIASAWATRAAPSSTAHRLHLDQRLWRQHGLAPEPRDGHHRAGAVGPDDDLRRADAPPLRVGVPFGDLTPHRCSPSSVPWLPDPGAHHGQGTAWWSLLGAITAWWR